MSDTDIVKRLRSHGVIPESLGAEAADEIERLRALNKRFLSIISRASVTIRRLNPPPPIRTSIRD